MKGREAVIEIGQKVIRLIRQKCMLRYGSAVCVEKHTRKITQWQDLRRGYQARINIHCFRSYLPTMKSILTLSQIIKILSQIQAGNCGEMSILTDHILREIVPPGLVVEIKTVKEFKDNQSHDFVTIRPQDTKDRQETLVIDPWPSNQLIKPEIVSMEEYFFGDKQIQSVDSFLNKSARINHTKLTTFDHVKINDFDLSKLQKIEELIDKKEILNNQQWNYQQYVISQQPPIHQLIAYKQQWELFKYRRLDIRNVRKETAILL